MNTNASNLSDFVFWNNPELWEQLELQAMDGTIDLFPLPLLSCAYFCKLSLISQAVQSGFMTEEETEVEKAKLLREFRSQIEKERILNEKTIQQRKEANEAYNRAQAVYVEYQKAIRTAGTLTSDIEKSHSVYEIMDIACMIIGLLTGDSSFHSRQLKKFPSGTMEDPDETH